jgi:hypothetical protein
MTVPFRPSVLPVPEPQTPFLDTITRAFLQTRNLVQADQATAQANQLFEDQRRQNKLRSETLADELTTRRQDRAIQIAEDPRIIQAPRPGAAAPGPVTAPAQPPIPAQPGIPPAPGEETIGGRIADELAPPPGGGAPVGGIPPQVAPGAPRGRGVTDIGGGLSFDPQGPARAQDAASARLREMLEQVAVGHEDPETGEAIRQAIPQMSAMIQTGQNPLQVVQATIGMVERIQAALRALPENARTRLAAIDISRLPLENQLEAVQAAGAQAAGTAADIAARAEETRIDERERIQAIELKRTPTGGQLLTGAQGEKPIGQRSNTKSLMTRFTRLFTDNLEAARSVSITDPNLPALQASGEVVFQDGKFIRLNVDEADIRLKAQLQALEERAILFTDEELVEVRARFDELADAALAGIGLEGGPERPTPGERTTQLLADGVTDPDRIREILRAEGYKVQ